MKNATTTDDELLHRLTEVVAEETEHREKIQYVQRKAQTNEVSLDQATKKLEQKKPNPLVDEITSLKAQICEITHLITKQANSQESQRKSGSGNKSAVGIPRCRACAKAKADFCDHCFRCGSTDHLRAGCKVRKSQTNQKN